jgi:hypothetical protein
MAKDHYIVPTGITEKAIAVRFGAGSGTANQWAAGTELNKAVKLAAESRYDLCVAGNEIEGFVVSVEDGTSNGFSVGSVVSEGTAYVVADGLQATPGTGVIAIGDYVVAGTVTAKGTALTSFAKVCKATAAGNTLNFKWRVVSLGTVGTGAVGTTIVIASVH